MEGIGRYDGERTTEMHSRRCIGLYHHGPCKILHMCLFSALMVELVCCFVL